MRTILSLLLLTALAGAQAVSGGKSTLGGNFISGSTVAAGGTSIGPMDAYTDLHGTTAGTTITTTILNTGTLGIANTANWGISGTAPVVAAHQSSCALLGTPQIDGTIYATSHTSLAASFANAAGFDFITVSTPTAGYDRASFFGCVTINLSGISGLFDIARLHGNGAGHLVVAQLSTLKCAGTLGWDLETTSATGTHNSACITATSGSTYFFSGYWDTVTSNAALAIFDSTGAQVGSTLTATGTDVGTGEDIGSIDFGNAEAGTASGSNVLEQMMVRWSGGSPGIINPINTPQASVYWVAQSHVNYTNTSGNHTSITTTKTLDLNTGDTAIGSCSSETATAAPSAMSDSGGDTFTCPAGLKPSLANGQSMAQCNSPISTPHTGVTFTCTLTASQFINLDIQILHGANATTPFDSGGVENKASGANNTLSTFTPGTATGANVICAYMQQSGLMTAGTGNYLLRTNTSDSMGCEMQISVPASAQTPVINHATGAASMASGGNYKQ